MATTSTRTVTVGFSGDVVSTLPFSAATNAASPGAMDLLSLTSGDNSISVPTGGSTPVAVTIIPPSGNTTAIILKGDSGDTGVRLHNTDPSSIALHVSQTTIVINVAADLAGIRLVWS